MVAPAAAMTAPSLIGKKRGTPGFARETLPAKNRDGYRGRECVGSVGMRLGPTVAIRSRGWPDSPLAQRTERAKRLSLVKGRSASAVASAWKYELNRKIRNRDDKESGRLLFAGELVVIGMRSDPIPYVRVPDAVVDCPVTLGHSDRNAARLMLAATVVA